MKPRSEVFQEEFAVNRRIPWTVTPGQKIPSSIRPLERKESAYGAFGRLLDRELSKLGRRLNDGPVERIQAWGISTKIQLEEELDKFRTKLKDATDKAQRGEEVSPASNHLFHHLQQAFISGNEPALAADLSFRFLASIIKVKGVSNDSTKELQNKLADLRYPTEWYPATRAMQRTIHLHVGPTNSGKTYHALKRLEAAKTGIYAGPLRLLAHEVYTRFNAMGKKCALITGEERRIPEGLNTVMNSCTVEMIPLNTTVDVAVIDEIQMLGDAERGWAWTQAFLGVMAKEVHLCGELRTVPLIRDLCALMGDKLIVHEYKRLGPLQSERHSLRGDLRKLEKGDAIILFSRVAIHAMKASVEKVKGKRCAVVYGSLPPETRAQQAALFNDPNNDYDYLVASNAVGMGLNLSIKRVIFESTSKHNGTYHARLEVPEINQIAGRAGRYKSAHDAIKQGAVGARDAKVPIQSRPNVGYVTTLDSFDLPIVQKAMTTNPGPLKSAGIFPPNDIVARFAALFPKETPFSYILLRLNELASVGSNFHLCRMKEQTEIADLIQDCKMTVMDRVAFISAPVSLREAGFIDVLIELAKCVSNQTGGELLDLKSLPIELLDHSIHEYNGGVKGYLRTAETLHKALTLYLWLSYRFAGVFRSQALAFHVKAMVEEKIDECLANVGTDDGALRRKNLQKFKILQKQADLKEQIHDAFDDEQEAEGKELGGESKWEDSPTPASNIPIPEEWEEGNLNEASL